MTMWPLVVWEVRRKNMITIIYFILMMLLVISCESCGPGKTGYKRRPLKKFFPALVQKQHIPNVSEFSLLASGEPEGKILRKTRRFKHQLVRVTNPDILFRDEEGTGADRYMTRRCKEKLEILSVMVMNQWPGIRLLVSEGYDEDYQHAKRSLHYEGRAVDIRTSDRDRKKYGVLGRLAVDAGFDWVFFESKAHVHCSCKSENNEFLMHAKYGGCFHANSTSVLRRVPNSTLTNSISIRDLEIGDEVVAADTADGMLIFSEVIAWLDVDFSTRTLFFEITTITNVTLTLTPSHLVHIRNMSHSIQLETRYARDLSVGDLLLRMDSDGINSWLIADSIVSIRERVYVGTLAPLTRHGTIMVNNISSSCYAEVSSSNIAHAVFAPLRWWTTIKNILYDRKNPSRVMQGVHPYANLLYSVSKYLMPKGFLFERKIYQ